MVVEVSLIFGSTSSMEYRVDGSVTENVGCFTDIGGGSLKLLSAVKIFSDVASVSCQGSNVL